MSTDSESNDEGTKLKETPENPKPQSSELVGEVFPYVKGISQHTTPNREKADRGSVENR